MLNSQLNAQGGIFQCWAGIRKCNKPFLGIREVLRADNRGCQKIKYPILINNHSYQKTKYPVLIYDHSYQNPNTLFWYITVDLSFLKKTNNCPKNCQYFHLTPQFFEVWKIPDSDFFQVPGADGSSILTGTRSSLIMSLFPTIEVEAVAMPCDQPPLIYNASD